MSYIRIKIISDWWATSTLNKLFHHKPLMYGLFFTFTSNYLTYVAIYKPFKDCSTSKRNKLFFRTPLERGMNYVPIIIKKNFVTLKGWFIKQTDSSTCPTVVFFQDNEGNLGGKLDYLQKYFEIVKCNIVVVAYRGYDESSGRPNQRGIQKDAIAITEYVFNNLDVDKSQVFVHGRGLGGAVAAYVSSRTQDKKPSYKGIILDNTFTSYLDVIPNLIPPLKFLMLFVISNTWITENFVQKIKNPMLFISSGQDKFVPTQNVKALQSCAKACKSISEFHIPNGDHYKNWEVDPADYFNTILKFINQHTN